MGRTMQKPIKTLHGYVAGRVQGVFFRAETRRKAVELGLRGWVRNLADGRVELLISGPELAIGQMREWLQNGPPLARVDELKLEPVDTVANDGFHVTS
jgi:acylphosphatase